MINAERLTSSAEEKSTMIDLHIHTNALPYHSTWPPEDLATAAAERGLTVIAAADHNTTANVAALQAAGACHGVRVVSGVEIDSGFNGKLWHTLVYNTPPDAPELLALCTAVYERNIADAAALRDALEQRGFTLPGLDDLGRAPNVSETATALARHNTLPGRVAGENDTASGMRYVLTQLPDMYHPVGVDEICAVAHRLGGIAVLAHPGRSNGAYVIPATERDIAEMAAVGLDGIEAYYPSHTEAQRAWFREMAKRHGLVITGGSDSHHPHQPLAAWDPALMLGLWERLG